jgi:hypothetical protein
MSSALVGVSVDLERHDLVHAPPFRPLALRET